MLLRVFLGVLLSVLSNNLLRDRIKNTILSQIRNIKINLLSSSMFSFLLETAQSAFCAVKHQTAVIWMVLCWKRHILVPKCCLGVFVVLIHREFKVILCVETFDYSSNHRKLRR